MMIAINTKIINPLIAFSNSIVFLSVKMPCPRIAEKGSLGETRLTHMALGMLPLSQLTVLT
jgi:hypothetical protein